MAAYSGFVYAPPPAPSIGPPPIQTIRTSDLEDELKLRELRRHRERSLSRQVSRSTTRDIAPSPALRGSNPVDGDIAEYIDWIKPHMGDRCKK